MQVKFGRATFEVSFGNDYDDDPMGDGTPGFGGTFEVNRKQYAELAEACPFDRYSIDESEPFFDPEEHDENEDIAVPNGDDFIVFMASAAIEGGEWRLHYNGAPYWFFHDLSHAEYDCSGGQVNIDSEGRDEDRALFDGAMRARAHGVKLGAIFSELAKALTPFRERFKRDTDALDRFAETLDHAEV